MSPGMATAVSLLVYRCICTMLSCGERTQSNNRWVDAGGTDLETQQQELYYIISNQTIYRILHHRWSGVEIKYVRQELWAAAILVFVFSMLADVNNENVTGNVALLLTYEKWLITATERHFHSKRRSPLNDKKQSSDQNQVCEGLANDQFVCVWIDIYSWPNIHIISMNIRRNHVYCRHTNSLPRDKQTSNKNNRQSWSDTG